MTSDLDILRTARMLINEHGEEASIEAAIRFDELLAKGDLEGRATWRRIYKAVKEMLDRSVPPGRLQ